MCVSAVRAKFSCECPDGRCRWKFFVERADPRRQRNKNSNIQQVTCASEGAISTIKLTTIVTAATRTFLGSQQQTKEVETVQHQDSTIQQTIEECQFTSDDKQLRRAGVDDRNNNLYY